MLQKRPYSMMCTARGTPRRYLLSGVPPTLSEQARAKARKERVAMRTLILSLLEAWTKRTTDPAVQP
jgi:hypothetical protein